MKAKKAVKTYRQAVVNTVILVIVLFLALYLIVQLSRNQSTSVSTQRTQTITETEYISLTGYIFRDESPVKAQSTGVADYFVRNGEKVRVGQTFAEFYPISDLNDSEIKKKQAHINELNLQIARLRSGLSGGTVSDLGHISEELSRSYYLYIDSVLDGDLSSADKEGALLLGTLIDYTVITGLDGEAENIADSLKAKKQELLSDFGSLPQPLICTESCYYFYSTDGYEEIFSYDKLEGMTSDSLKKIIVAKPLEYGANIIGNAVYSPQWYLAVPTDEATALRFSEGAIYEIKYSGGSSLKMNLERISVDEEGAYLLFSSFDLSLSSDMLRTQNIKIKMGDCSGYRIPSSALIRKNGESGVYILIGTVVEFRRVTVIGEGNGYYIVNTNEADIKEGTVSSIPYLNINDLIITSGNDLYDGKLLD